MTDSQLLDADFQAIEEEVDQNPCFTQAWKVLTAKLNQPDNNFLLTMAEGMIDQADHSSDSDVEEKQSEVYALIHRSVSASKVLYQGAE